MLVAKQHSLYACFLCLDNLFYVKLYFIHELHTNIAFTKISPTLQTYVGAEEDSFIDLHLYGVSDCYNHQMASKSTLSCV